MSAWLITGGAGFIGTNFVRLCAERVQQPLVVLDVLSYAGNYTNIADLVESGRVDFVQGSICDSDLVRSLFDKYQFDRVIHFAAESHVDRSIHDPQAFLKTNIEGTYVLLNAARLHWAENVSDKRFLHVSTDEVYGDLEPNDPPFTENTSYSPSSPYSASKAASDHLVAAWHRTYGLPTVISNCSNNYGPWQFPEKLIPLMILNAHEERELPVYGDGLQIRDWLHVEDHCEALLLLLEKGVSGETYNVGGGNEITNIEIIKNVCSIVDELTGRSKGTSVKLIKTVADRLGHDRRYAVDSSKLQNNFKWKPKHQFSDSLPSVVSWYLDNLKWADDIRSGEYRLFYEKQYKHET